MKTLSYEERLHRVLRHIENSLDSRPDLAELAEIACFSPYHFHRIFSSMMGESVAAYVRRLLLERAAQQVAHTRDPITLIALDAGYESVDAFTRAFRAHFDALPSEYRRTDGHLTRARKQNPDAPLFHHQIVGVPPLEIRVTKFAPLLVAAMRNTGPYEDCGPAWLHLFSLLGPAGLLHEGMVAYGVSHDNPDVTPKDKCRMDVCVSLPQGVSEETPAIRDLLRNKELFLRHIGSECDYVAMKVQGDYALLHPAYRSLFGQWFPQSGREPVNDPGFEAYYNSPQTTAPEDLLTEIFIPMKPE